MVDELRQAGIKVNDPGNPGKFYLCGKGITRFSPMAPEANETMRGIRRTDSARMAEMTSRLAGMFSRRGLDTGLDDQGVIDMVVERHGCPRRTVVLQERHVAMAFQKAFFRLVGPQDRRARLAELFGCEPKSGPEDAVGCQEEIRTHLLKAGKAAFVFEKFLDFDRAYRLVLALGGIPCYPILADGTSPICPFEQPVEKLVERLRERGIFMAELCPVRNRPEVVAEYARTLRGAGIAVLGGTEHNTLHMLPMVPVCLGGVPVPDDVKEIFWEAACVVAAHQHLIYNGRDGFVDSRGGLNPSHESDDRRIEAFREIGEAVFGRYLRACEQAGN